MTRNRLILLMVIILGLLVLIKFELDLKVKKKIVCELGGKEYVAGQRFIRGLGPVCDFCYCDEFGEQSCVKTTDCPEDGLK